MLKSISAALAATLTLTPALAQDYLTRPAACQAYLTVRHQSCSTATYFTCGDTFRVEQAYQGAPSLIALYDANYNTIGGGSPDGALTMTAKPGADSTPLSLADLRATGSAKTADVIDMDVQGFALTMFMNSTVTIAPGTVEISGKTFRVAEMAIDMRTEPDVGPMSARTRLFLNDEIGFPVEGETANTVAGKTEVTSTDPAELIFPGQPDFGTLTPRPGCGAVSG